MDRQEIIKQIEVEYPFITKQELVYAIVIKEILTFNLKIGDKVSQSKLSSDLNISRGPVKSALEKLKKEGFLINDNTGVFVVNKLSARFTADILSFKRQLDILAVNQAIFNMTKANYSKVLEKLNNMAKAINTGNFALFCESDIDFHLEIVKTACNTLLTDTYSRYRLLFLYISIMNEPDKATYDKMFYFHKKIYQALSRQDQDGANIAINQHYSTIVF